MAVSGSRSGSFAAQREGQSGFAGRSAGVHAGLTMQFKEAQPDRRDAMNA
jgi:hypothetical protein